jgi:hypothetical protein
MLCQIVFVYRFNKKLFLKQWNTVMLPSSILQASVFIDIKIKLSGVVAYSNPFLSCYFLIVISEKSFLRIVNTITLFSLHLFGAFIFM